MRKAWQKKKVKNKETKKKKKRKKAVPKGKLCKPLDKNAINLFSREKTLHITKVCIFIVLEFVFVFVSVLFCFFILYLFEQDLGC